MTRSKSAPRPIRKLAIKTTPTLLFLSVFDALCNYTLKTESVIWKRLWDEKEPSLSLKDDLRKVINKYKATSVYARLLGGMCFRGKTLNGRLDRCPPIFRGMLLQRSLSDKYTFTLNFGRRESEKFLHSSKGFTHFAKAALSKALLTQLGYVPNYFFFVEEGSAFTKSKKGLIKKVSGRGTLHIHGMIERGAYDLLILKEAMANISSFTGHKTHFGLPFGDYTKEMRRHIDGLTESDAIKAKSGPLYCLSRHPEFSHAQFLKEDYAWAQYMTKDFDGAASVRERSGRGAGRGWTVSDQTIMQRGTRFLWLFKALLESA
ncbi:MAG: hypothetical protein V4628_08325 [Pseudomonadota bacterium]